MKKQAWLLSLMLVLSMFLVACSGGDGASTDPETPDDGEEQTEEPGNDEPQQGGDLVVGLTGNPSMFNPLYGNDTASSDIYGLLFAGLVGSDLEFNPVTENGALADTIDVSEDGLTYTVKLKENIKFHDGEALTADDVVFTYEIPLSDDYDGVRKSYFESLDSVEKIDDLTIQFNLNQVDVQFPVVGLSFGILPQHILGDVAIADLGEHEFNTKKPIGSGPFKFDEWVDGEYVRIVAFDDFHEGRPYLDQITYKIVPDANAVIAQLQAGDIDFFSGVPSPDVPTVEAFAPSVGLKLENGLALSYTFFALNQRDERFADVKVRQAITHAIDREAIVAAVMGGLGEVAHVPESPLSWAYNPDVPTFDYDIEKSKALLEEAGWTPGSDGILEKDGQKLSFDVKTNQGNKVREDIAVILQQQLKEVGIEATPLITEWSALINDINPPARDFEGLILGWSLGTDPDPSGIFHTKNAEQGNNLHGYSNPTLDELMDAQLRETDKEKRKEMIGEIQVGLAEEQAYTFLYYPQEFRAMPENLQGYEFHGKDPFFNAHKWYLAE